MRLKPFDRPAIYLQRFNGYPYEIACQVKQIIVYYHTVKHIIQFVTECKDN